jgi:hypothetical protein
MRGQFSSTFRLETIAETIGGKSGKADILEAGASTRLRSVESKESHPAPALDCSRAVLADPGAPPVDRS